MEKSEESATESSSGGMPLPFDLIPRGLLRALLVSICGAQTCCDPEGIPARLE